MFDRFLRMMCTCSHKIVRKRRWRKRKRSKRYHFHARSVECPRDVSIAFERDGIFRFLFLFMTPRFFSRDFFFRTRFQSFFDRLTTMFLLRPGWSKFFLLSSDGEPLSSRFVSSTVSFSFRQRYHIVDFTYVRISNTCVSNDQSYNQVKFTRCGKIVLKKVSVCRSSRRERWVRDQICMTLLNLNTIWARNSFFVRYYY